MLPRIVNWPKITIVTENLNHGVFLDSMIRSVVSQEYPDLEYIIIDGASEDNSIEVIKRYQDQIAYWCSESDDGLYDACNKGFAHSSGEIMAWVGSDDMLLPGALHAVGGIFAAHPEIEWLTTLNPGEFDHDGSLLPARPVAGFSRQAFVEGYYLAGPHPERGYHHPLGWIQAESTFWRRSLWEKTGGRFRCEYFRYAADFDLWCRFALNAEIYSTPYMIAGWRRRAGQASSRGNHYAVESAKAMEEHLGTSSLRPNKLRQAVLRRGLQHIPVARRVLRRRIGYTGRIVVREKPNEHDSHWIVQEHRFL